MIDPSYLRNIRDGIKNGNIQKDNLLALPEGITGLFDREIFRSSMKMEEKREILLFFLSFALVQKEISLSFAAEILNWNIGKVETFFLQFTKRFSSPGKGLLRLYHDRFRVYILQKITARDIKKYNDKIIELCEIALKERKSDEKERYALEFLSTHLYIHAIENVEYGAKLKSLAYSQSHWNRQIEISKSFEWPKKMLNEMMRWASKYDDEEVIECALNKIDLHYLEQNDAPRILEMVAQNDIDTALLRIENYGGNDKDGLQRKFILYMLCLMELTLLDSKNQDFTKSAIERILKHLDENLPVDHSILNWNDFFPSYLVFQVCRYLHDLDLEYNDILRRTENCDFSFIERVSELCDEDFIFLLEFEDYILTGYENKSKILSSRAKFYARNNEYYEAKKNTFKINNHAIKSETFLQIIQILSLDGEKRKHLLKLSRESAMREKNEFQKISALGTFISNLQQITDYKIYKNVLNEVKNIYFNIDDIIVRLESMLLIAFATLKFGNNEDYESILLDILKLKKDINDPDKLISFLCKFSNCYYQIGDKKKCNKILSEIQSICESTPSGYSKSFRFQELISEYSRQKKFIRSLQLIQKIEDEYIVNETLSIIVPQIAKSRYFKKAIKITETISWDEHKEISYLSIASEISLNRDFRKAKQIILNSITLNKGITNFNERHILLESVAINLAKIKNYNASLSISKNINDRERKGDILAEITTGMANQGEISQFLAFTRLIIENEFIHTTSKSKLVKSLSNTKVIYNHEFKLLMIGATKISIDKSSDVNTDNLGIINEIEFLCAVSKTISDAKKVDILNAALKLAKKIKPISERISTMITILNYYEGERKNKLRKIILDLTAKIKNYNEKSKSVFFISSEFKLFDKSQCNEILNILIDDLNYTDKRNNDENKRLISISFAKIKKFNKAIVLANEIDSILEKSIALNEISVELLKNGKTTDAFDLVLTIIDYNERVKCLMDLAEIFLSKYGLKAALNEITNFSSDQLIKSWLFKVAEMLTLSKVSILEVAPTEFTCLLFHNKLNLTALNNIIHIYAFRQLFFSNLPPAKLDRYNRTLNLQWAIDLKNQLN